MTDLEEYRRLRNSIIRQAKEISKGDYIVVPVELPAWIYTPPTDVAPGALRFYIRSARALKASMPTKAKIRERERRYYNAIAQTKGKERYNNKLRWKLARSLIGSSVYYTKELGDLVSSEEDIIEGLKKLWK